MTRTRKNRKIPPKARGGRAQQLQGQQRGRQVPTWQKWLSGVIGLYMMIAVLTVAFFIAAIIAALIPANPVVQGLVAAGNILGGLAGMFSVWISLSSHR